MKANDKRRNNCGGPNAGVSGDLKDILFERHLEKQEKAAINRPVISKAPSCKYLGAVRRDIQAIKYAKEDAAIDRDHK